MSSLAVLRELPAEFEVVAGPRAVLAMRRDASEALQRAGFGLDSDGALLPSGLSGRKPLHELALGERRLIVRRFTHGGLLRWLTGARFLDPERPFRELVDAERLAHAGVPTAKVVAARARRAGLFGWRLDLLTERLPGAVDLASALRTPGPAQRRELITAAGRLVARLHALGFVHADLHPRNLLVESPAAPRLRVLDLDRSVWRAPLLDDERRGNLRRLLRYAERELDCSPRDYARFLRAYQPAPAARKADWRAIRAAHERARAWHAVGRWMERVGGRQRPAEIGSKVTD